MPDTGRVELAAAAEALRRLLHTPADDTATPADVYFAVGELVTVLQRLPQVMDRLAASTRLLADNPNLGVDDNRFDAHAEALAAAAALAVQPVLLQHVSEAHQRLARLNLAEPS